MPAGSPPTGPRTEPTKDGSDERIEVLNLVLADVEAERDRLRSARASFSTRLGPLPASVAVVTGIAAAAAGKVDLLFAILAGVVFAGVLAVSIFFGGLKPYREIRAVYQGAVDPNFEREAASLPFRKDDADLADWLNKKIELERRIYGPLIDRKWRWVPLPKVESLRDGIVTERAAANIVQALFLVIAAILIIGIAVH